jgi:hypothetical protein
MTLPELDARLKRVGEMQVPEKNLQGPGTNIWQARFAIVPAETPPPVQTAGDTIPKALIPPDGGLEIQGSGKPCGSGRFQCRARRH